MKPDWSKAPEWANYLAMDESGGWFWYEHEPYISCGEWVSCWQIASASDIDWTTTLEERP